MSSGGAILIVDDAETSAAALEVACAAIPGIEVQLARSAVEALVLLRDSGERIRAVITDLHMPCMDGFQFIRLLRADDRYRQVPIVVVSADTDPRTPERAQQWGASAYFSKPYSPAAVRARLEQLLDARNSL